MMGHDNLSTTSTSIGNVNIGWTVGEEILFEGSAQPLLLELEHFLECCRERQRPISDGRNGYEVVRVLEESEHQLSAQRK